MYLNLFDFYSILVHVNTIIIENNRITIYIIHTTKNNFTNFHCKMSSIIYFY